MKRMITAILALTLLLSLCACGADGGAGKKPQPYNPDKDIPTEEEAAMLEEYKEILKDLEYKVQSDIFYGYADEGLDAEDCVEYFEYYDKLLSMEALDKWLDKPGFIENYEGFQSDCYVVLAAERHYPEIVDRHTLLSRFTPVVDQPSYITFTETDKMGNSSSYLWYPWTYDESGNLIETGVRIGQRGLYNDDPLYEYAGYPIMGSYYQISCNADGQMEKKTFFTYANNNTYEISSILTYEYDSQGRITQETLVKADSNYDVVYSYTYGSNGLVESVSWYDGQYVRTFAYDDQGRVTTDTITEYDGEYDWKKATFSPTADQTLIDNVYRVEYTYEQGQQPVSAVFTEENWSWNKDFGSDVYEPYCRYTTENNYSYTYDENGRILTLSLTYGDTIYATGDKWHEAGEVHSSSYSDPCVLEFHYGSYAFYNAPTEAE